MLNSILCRSAVIVSPRDDSAGYGDRVQRVLRSDGTHSSSRSRRDCHAALITRKSMSSCRGPSSTVYTHPPFIASSVTNEPNEPGSRLRQELFGSSHYIRESTARDLCACCAAVLITLSPASWLIDNDSHSTLSWTNYHQYSTITKPIEMLLIPPLLDPRLCCRILLFSNTSIVLRTIDRMEQ
jgi:hypothetical protein